MRIGPRIGAPPALVPALEQEWSGADRRQAEAVRAEPVPALRFHHQRADHALRQDGIRFPGCDLERQRRGRRDRDDAAQFIADHGGAAGSRDQPLDDLRRGARIEGPAVRVADARAQLEAPARRFDQLPGQGQRGPQPAVFVELREAVEQCVPHERAGPAVALERIAQAGRESVEADAQRAGGLRRRVRRRREQGEEQQQRARHSGMPRRAGLSAPSRPRAGTSRPRRRSSRCVFR